MVEINFETKIDPYYFGSKNLKLSPFRKQLGPSFFSSLSKKLNIIADAIRVTRVKKYYYLNRRCQPNDKHKLSNTHIYIYN
jgi:hypothetical protein